MASLIVIPFLPFLTWQLSLASGINEEISPDEITIFPTLFCKLVIKFSSTGFSLIKEFLKRLFKELSVCSLGSNPKFNFFLLKTLKGYCLGIVKTL